MTNEEFVKELLKSSSNARTVWNAAISACIEIAQRYEYSDAHNMEIEEMEDLVK